MLDSLFLRMFLPRVCAFLVLFGCLSACSSGGGHWQHYRLMALSEARNRGMTIYLHFHQPGNPTSEKQKEALEAIIQDPDFKKVGAYRVTWETERPLQKAYQVSAPATVLVFKGEDEKSRAIGATDPKLLKQILLQGL